MESLKVMAMEAVQEYFRPLVWTWMKLQWLRIRPDLELRKVKSELRGLRGKFDTNLRMADSMKSIVAFVNAILPLYHSRRVAKLVRVLEYFGDERDAYVMQQLKRFQSYVESALENVVDPEKLPYLYSVNESDLHLPGLRGHKLIEWTKKIPEKVLIGHAERVARIYLNSFPGEMIRIINQIDR